VRLGSAQPASGEQPGEGELGRLCETEAGVLHQTGTRREPDVTVSNCALKIEPAMEQENGDG